MKEEKKQFTIYVGVEILQALEARREEIQRKIKASGIAGVKANPASEMARNILRKELGLLPEQKK